MPRHGKPHEPGPEPQPTRPGPLNILNGAGVDRDFIRADPWNQALARLLRNGPEPLVGPPEPPQPACPICNDLGRVYADPDGITTKLCVCREAAWQAALPARLLSYWERHSGVPSNLRDLRLDQHFGHLPADLLAALKDTAPLAPRRPGAAAQPPSWYFWGEPSAGKSGIAAALCWNYLQTTGEAVLFRTVPDFLSDLKATYDRQSRAPATYDSDDPPAEGLPTEYEVLTRLKTAGLLVLDDCGAEHITEWTKERIYAVVNARLGDLRPTVFTSNYGLPALQERLGPRISERIIEMCGRGKNIVQVQGANLRWGE